MTITKTLKTKLVLGILAAAASLTLAVGGTLMLFTDTSGPATNVVTLDSAEIELQESNGTTDSNGFIYHTIGDPYITGKFENGTYDDTIFKGINFGNEIVPGDTLNKRPRVHNSGSVPVYVYVDGVLSVKDANEENVDLTAEDAEGKAVAAQVKSILDSVVDHPTTGWYGMPIDYAKANEGILTGTWYYATALNTPTVLQTGTDTPDIFTTIQLDRDIVDNALAGYTISIDLHAYAVQSAHNESADFGSLKKLFSSADEEEESGNE
jgi:hypothetical protein